MSEQVEFVKATSPYLRKKSSVYRMMGDVLIALLPVVVFSIVAFTWRAAIIICVSLATVLLTEYLFALITKRQKDFGWANILSGSVTAIIFAMIVPASVNWYVAMIGSFAGILVGKLLFGGLGSNIFNPAAVGMVIVKISFPKFFNAVSVAPFDVTTSATALSSVLDGAGYGQLANYSVLDLFLGNTAGTLGEICKIAIIVGAAYLFIRRSADFRPCLAYLLTTAIYLAIAGIFISHGNTGLSWPQFFGVEMLGGGLLFGAVFMFTDPVTSPITRPGRYMFGMIGAIATVFIRLFAALPEGVVFSILIANMLTPLLDYYKWSSNFFTKKKILAMVILFFVPLILLTIILASGGLA